MTDDGFKKFSTRKRALMGFFGTEILNHYGSKREFKKGTVVFREGEKGDYLFVSKSGKFKVMQKKEGSQAEKVVAWLTEGHIVGEMAVLTGKPRSATVEAIEDSTVYIIDTESLYQIFKKFPHVREIIGLESVKREEENIMSILEDDE